MNTMFTENLEKEIPKSLNDCYKTDNLTKNLWIWCERIEKVGIIFFRVLIVLGIIISIIGLINDMDYNEDQALPNLITTFTTWGIYAFIEYVSYHVIALLIGSLASIVQHTKITANVALYNCKKQFSDSLNVSKSPAIKKVSLNNTTKNDEPRNNTIKKTHSIQNNIRVGENHNSKNTTTPDVNCNCNDNEFSSTNVEIKCPQCTQTLYFPKGETDVVCSYCLHVFTIE